MTGSSPTRTRRPGRLWLQLLKIGLAAARTTPGTRLRFWALMAASAALDVVSFGVLGSLTLW